MLVLCGVPHLKNARLIEYEIELSNYSDVKKTHDKLLLFNHELIIIQIWLIIQELFLHV
jgi:hypothetical protein